MLDGSGREVVVINPPSPFKSERRDFQDYSRNEIKPKRPGILRDYLKEKNIEVAPLDYVIVFGQGPVLDAATKEKPDPNKANVTADSTMWQKSLCRAAGEMYLAGMMKTIVLTGGMTGGAALVTKEGKPASEAQMMEDILVEEYGVPKSAIKRGDTATNSLMNFAEVDEFRGSKGLLGSNFHLSRLRVLADLFDVGSTHAFSGEQILKLVAKASNDRELENLLDARLNPNEPKVIYGKQPRGKDAEMKTYLENLKGLDSSPLQTKFREANTWTRALLEKPAYWIGFLYYIKDESRIRKILGKLDITQLRSMGIVPADKDLKTTDINGIRQELLPYTKQIKKDSDLKPGEVNGKREMADINIWGTESYPIETRVKLQRITDRWPMAFGNPK